MTTKLNTHYLLSIILILFFLFSPSKQQSCNSQDKASLLSFSSHLSTSSFPLNWSSSINCCSWEGVHCDANGRVTALQLRSLGLAGKISSSIKNLTSLIHLDLSKNSLTGDLPTGLFKSLSNLQIVDFSFNNLEGKFLSNETLPANIYTVDISNNYFHGEIESGMFSEASQLSSFNSSKNSFTGAIPSSICKNSPLLNELNFAENNITGSIPPSLLNCTNLVSLILNINRVEGNLTTVNFSKLVRLQKLDLAHNLFTGTLPESLYSCKEIVAVRVAGNNLTGQISPKIVDLNSLSFLSLTNNSFSNITSALTILSSCKNLTTLFLGYNFKGETLQGNTSFLDSNGFPNLQYNSLISCNFTGYFPQWISYLKNLRILDLSYNRVTGTIPKWLGDMPKLFALDLSGNSLSGEIPRELCLLPALVSANLSSLNHLYFDLPVFSIFPGRKTWDQFIVYPPQIILQNNKFSGIIPSQIGNLQNLHKLYLNGNNLAGAIPVQISYLKNLEQLSLAQNHLKGELPTGLASLNFLSKFNVSYNDLQGPIPTGGQFDTFLASSYEGNPGLCGQVLHHPCSSVQNEQPDQNDDEPGGRDLFIDGLAVGLASGFSGILAIVASCVWYKNLHFATN